MKILLDTCAIIWAISSADQLSKKARRILSDIHAEVSVSSISCAEIACAVANKKIVLDKHWKLWFRQHTNTNRWEIFPIDLPVIEEAFSLPGDFHRDPADRIIVATARLYQATLLTADHKILNYPHVETIW